MKYLLLLPVWIILSLSGCKEDKNPLFGTWQGTISDEHRKDLDITKDLASDELIIVFNENHAVINGQAIEVAYNKNLDVHFVNELGTSRTMSITFSGNNQITLRVPGHYKQKILSFKLERISQP